MKEEKVEFYNNKDQKIVGLLSIPEGENFPIAIITHGFKGTKEYYPFANNSVKPLIDIGIAVLRIDCRGSGESDLEFKEMTMKSESEDVLTAINYVNSLQNINSQKIALIGISMGTAAILMAMESKPIVEALVFWGPGWYFNGDSYFDTPKNRKSVEQEGVFYVTQKFTGKKLVAGKELFKEITTLDIRPFMKHIEIPSLVLRGSEDRVVGLERDKEAVMLLRSEYKIIKNGDHNFTDKKAERELIRTTVDWLNRQLN